MSKKKILFLSILGVVLVAVVVLALIPPAGEKLRVYGKPIDRNAGEVIEFSRLFAETEAYVGKNVIVEARIGIVCQISGCWVILRDGANQLRVQFYDFTVRLSPGDAVRVSGQLRVRNQAPYLVGQGVEVIR